MSLLRVREAVISRMRPLLYEHGLSEQQWRVLQVLDAASPIRASELSQRTLISPPSLTRLLRTLEEHGWIIRRDDPDDSRAMRLSPSAAGRRLTHALAPQAEALDAALAKQLGKTRLMALDALLNEVSAVLGNVPLANGDE